VAAAAGAPIRPADEEEEEDDDVGPPLFPDPGGAFPDVVTAEEDSPPLALPPVDFTVTRLQVMFALIGIFSFSLIFSKKPGKKDGSSGPRTVKIAIKSTFFDSSI